MSALGILAALGWLLWISILYLSGAAARLDPVFEPPLRFFVVMFACLAVISACLGALRQPGLARYYCYGLVALAGAGVVAILIEGRLVTAVATVVWLTALGWGSGQWLLSRLVGDAGPRGAGRAAFAIALAFGLASHVVLALSLAGAIHRRLTVLALAGLSIVLRRDLLRLLRALPRAARTVAGFASEADSWFRLPLLTLMCGWFLFMFVHAVAPETQFDAMSYHLALPRIYIEHGRYVETRYLFQSWFFLGAEMNYLLAMLVGGQVAAKLVHFAFLLVTAAAIVHFGERHLGPRAGVFAAAMYATTPLVVWEASTAYVDLALACYSLLAVAAVCEWMRDRRAQWLWVAGLMAGFAISVKVSALYLILPLAAAILVVALVDRSGPRRPLSTVAFAAAAILAGLPWPLLRWVQTGNPVFPFFNNFFKSPDWPAGRRSPLPTFFGIGYAPGDLVQLPWALTFHTERFHEGAPAAVIGLGLLILPLLVLRRPFPRTAALLAALLVPFGLFWIYSGHQYLRFGLPALPLVSLLAGCALAGAWGQQGSALASSFGRFVPTTLVLLLVAASLPLTLPLFSIMPGSLPLNVALGREAPDAYRARLIPSYNAYRAIEQRHPGEPIHVVALWDEYRLYAPGIVEPLWSPVLPEFENEDQAFAALRAHGVTHLLINRTTPPAPRGRILLQPSFVERFGELEYSGRGIDVYFLREPKGR